MLVSYSEVAIDIVDYSLEQGYDVIGQTSTLAAHLSGIELLTSKSFLLLRASHSYPLPSNPKFQHDPVPQVISDVFDFQLPLVFRVQFVFGELDVGFCRSNAVVSALCGAQAQMYLPQTSDCQTTLCRFLPDHVLCSMGLRSGFRGSELQGGCQSRSFRSGWFFDLAAQSAYCKHP